MGRLVSLDNGELRSADNGKIQISGPWERQQGYDKGKFKMAVQWKEWYNWTMVTLTSLENAKVQLLDIGVLNITRQWDSGKIWRPKGHRYGCPGTDRS